MTRARTLILTFALALAAPAANAAASDYMPSAMIGEWCLARDGKTTHVEVYRRGGCRGAWPHVVDDRLSVDRSGFYVHEFRVRPRRRRGDASGFPAATRSGNVPGP